MLQRETGGKTKLGILGNFKKYKDALKDSRKKT